MKRFIIAVILFTALAGCGASSTTTQPTAQLDSVEHITTPEGVECIVLTKPGITGIGLSCDWGKFRGVGW